MILIFFVLSALVVNDFSSSIASPLNQGEAVYIVQQSDTLNSIALQFGVSVSELQEVNNIADPNTLMIGQRLIIPGLSSVDGILTTAELPLGTSLTRLLRQYRIDQEDLVTLNRITSPSETIAGLKYILPLSEDEELLKPIKSIKREETPLEAAIRTRTSHWIIVENNQLSATWEMLPGETLYGEGEENSSTGLITGISKISVNNLPLIQGETTEFWIVSDENASISGALNGEPLSFFSDDGRNFYNYYGVHALAEIGPVSLELTTKNGDGSTETFEQLVLVVAGGYGNEYVNVGDEYLDQSVIEEEDALVQSLLRNTSSSRFWDDRFQYPVDEPCINSLFGQRRDYNNGGLSFYHTGLDFGVCAPNLNIYATAAGKVILAEELTIRGKAILIDHGWGVVSGYWHLSEFSVSAGAMVEAGDLIGQIGNTGRSAGPHLHFEIDIFGTPVNPQTWLAQEFPSIEP
jgi:murein DD-endopeptidase MepM/ murein hydrolase activator NlpD